MALIKMYTKVVCPYCVKAKAYLKGLGVTEIHEINIEGDDTLKSEMISLSGRQTVPQIFIGNKHIGGCDDLLSIKKDELLKMINE